MKKIITTVLLSAFIMVSAIPSYAANNIGVTLNNNPVSFDTSTGYPFIDPSGRTLVPLRQTMEAAGFTVTWNSPNNVATVSDAKGTKVYVKIGDNYITKEINNNGNIETSRIKNDTFAQVVNHRTYLPIRAVLECFGASVSWDNTGHNVIVNTSGISSTASTALTAEEIYSKYSPAVFYIELYDNNNKPIASGSGFFIDSKGTAITNYHVIEGASSAKVTTTNGKTYNVEGVYAFDKVLDLAKIKISGNGFTHVNIANPYNVVGGSKTYAIGSPLGLDSTISEGIISNPNRMINDKSYYQITTPISHGSSGGALFDKNGNVIGITFGGFAEGQNLNLAIPITNINKLSSTTLSKLNTITSLNANNNIAFLASKSNLSLESGKSTTVVMSYNNYDSDVECNYCIDDESIVTGTWGEWTDNTIPLKIEALKAGQTTITITLNDYNTKKILSTKTIQVAVSKGSSTQYYKGFYPAPDLGEVFGVPVYYSEQTTEDITCYYDVKDLYYASPDFVNEYSDLVIANGFDLVGSFDDDDGDTVLLYKNDYYGLALYQAYKEIHGVGSYIVMVFQE